MSDSARSSSLPPLPGAKDWPRLAPGHVWLVGGGPGDPGLLTLHALNALEQADVIVHDALVGAAILDWAPAGAERISMGKRGGRPSPKQDEISALLIRLAVEGKRVVRLKGGDPFVFGRGGEEALALVAAGVPVRVVPGISAGIGGLAMAGIPVTHGAAGQAVTFVTGHDREGTASADWAAIARASATIVIYMGLRKLDEIANALIAAGRPESEPVALVAEASLPGQRVFETTLGACARAVAEAGFEGPAIICVGEVARLRQALAGAAP